MVVDFDIASIVYVLLALFGLLVALYVLIRLFSAIGRLVSRGRLFGSEPTTRLISLGLAALLFPKIFYAIGNAVIGFISNFFIDAPRSLLDNFRTAQEYCSEVNYAADSCIRELGFAFIQGWTSALSDSLDYFRPDNISYSQLILMLAFWAIGALFLSTAPNIEDSSNKSDARIALQNAIMRLSKPAKQNIIFFLILVLAGYLSVAAIAAIPGLQESAVPSDAISAERLEQQLTDALAESQANMTQPFELSDPIVVLEEELNENPDATPVQRRKLTELKGSRQRLLGFHQKLLLDVQNAARESISEATSAYRTSLIDRKGSQETVQHFLSIDSWFRDRLDSLEARVDACRINIVYLESWYAFAVERANNPLPVSIDQISIDPVAQAERTCLLSSDQSLTPIPPRPDLGSNLGPFSYVASWLLRTESLPLAQIVGLLGFGLLGSAVSTLVRSDSQRGGDQPLVTELATVIIRGATAAVVVFLAVKGGLAIFTSGDSEPNSYVLLLTCLIAAVFSEVVWQDAHRRLIKALSGANSQNTDSADSSDTYEEEKNVTTKPALDENSENSLNQTEGGSET